MKKKKKIDFEGHLVLVACQHVGRNTGIKKAQRKYTIFFIHRCQVVLKHMF